MTRNNRRKRGGKAGAYETAGGPGGTAQQVLGPVDGNLTQPSPATPRKSLLSLLGSGVRTPSRTPNASRFLNRNTSEAGVPPTPSTPSARGAGPDTRPCADSGEGRASDGAPFIRTPKMQQKRGAAGSGRGLRPSGGRSRSHRKRRKERTAEMERLPGISDRLENEEYREQQRVAREEKVARRAQEIADDQTKKDEASRRPRPGRRSSTRAGASPSSSTLFVDPRRRQSAPAALGGNQPRSRMKECDRVNCGWAPSASNIKCGGCRGEVVHSTTDALCAACHGYLPGGKATHLRRERQQLARVFVQSVQAGGDGMPAVVVRNFEPSGDCLCLRGDCFHAFLERSGDGQPQGPRRCSTCKECKKDCQWHNVGVEDSDGMTVEHTGEAWSGAAHVPPVDCHACFATLVRSGEGTERRPRTPLPTPMS